jgi:hypothetical protein
MAARGAVKKKVTKASNYFCFVLRQMYVTFVIFPPTAPLDGRLGGIWQVAVVEANVFENLRGVRQCFCRLDPRPLRLRAPDRLLARG